MHRKEVRKIKERLSKSIYDKVKATLDSMTFPEPKMIRDFKVDII